MRSGVCFLACSLEPGLPLESADKLATELPLTLVTLGLSLLNNDIACNRRIVGRINLAIEVRGALE